MPEITVMVVARNEQRFIRAALESAQAQTLKPVEVVVFDDASADDTARVAGEFATGRVPTRVIRSPIPGGSIAGRNRLLAEAQTEWVAVLDADDIWLPRKLERQWALLESWGGSKPVVVLGTKGRHINEKGRDIGSYDPKGGDSEHEFERVTAGRGFPTVGHSAALFRREDALGAGGYDEQSLGAEDMDLWERMALLRRGLVLNVTEPLFLYRKKRGGMMHTLARIQQLNFERLAENRTRRREGLPGLTFAEFEQLRAQRPFHERLRWEVNARGAWWYRFGAMSLANGSYGKGTAQLAAAGFLRPRLVISGVRRALS